MPPMGDKLSDEVIAAFEKWVRDGAVWEPLTPPPPRTPPPVTEAEAPAPDAADDQSDH